MRKLISLELKRNGLRSYHTCVLISTVVMLSFLYLMAVLPKLDPSEADLGMFLTYESLVNMTSIILMAIFIILSSAMSAKFIVEEYSGKRAVLLFSYPVKRRSVLNAKAGMVFCYTVFSMLLSGAVIFGVFYISESFIHLCADEISLGIILKSLLLLVSYSLLSGVWGMVALWFGFKKQSVIITIVAAVVISVLLCQSTAVFMAVSPFAGVAIFLIIGVPASLAVLSDIKNKVQRMEI